MAANDAMSCHGIAITPARNTESRPTATLQAHPQPRRPRDDASDMGVNIGE